MTDDAGRTDATGGQGTDTDGRRAAEPFLTGERVALRALERDDIGFVRDAVNDPRVRSALGLCYPSTRSQEEAWFDEATDRDDALAFVVGTSEGERAGDTRM